MVENCPKVYQAMSAVQDEIAKLGIVKNRKNVQQGYAFRGIDDIYNTLAPVFAKHKLLVVPNVLSREMSERTTKKGDALFSVVVYSKFTFISAEDGSSVEASTYGEAMDTADKATNKAMSAAYKYVCLQTFSIPTEGDNDADATTHDVAPRKPSETPTKKAEIIDPKHLRLLNGAQTLEELNEAMGAVKAELGDNFADVRSLYVPVYTKRRKELTK